MKQEQANVKATLAGAKLAKAQARLANAQARELEILNKRASK